MSTSSQTPQPGTVHHRLLALLDRYADPQSKLDAYLAEKLRDIANTLEVINPDRSAEFSEGVDWAIERLKTLADELSGGAA
ncbi:MULTISPECIES: hypothetical protein [unclassified Streptomyces]|uniref:hypothetical protein n=1 Tax=unclassified Streptomyces TaxID=2593676 RepID=UPI0033A60CF4